MTQKWYSTWWAKLIWKTFAGTAAAYFIIVYLPVLTGLGSVNLPILPVGLLLWLSASGVFSTLIILIVDFKPALFHRFAAYGFLFLMLVSIVLITTVGEDNIRWKLLAGMLGFASAILFFFPIEQSEAVEEEQSEDENKDDETEKLES